ncbi:MAG: S8 family serine peptidase [Bdellovibrionales bacterium]|nr:S8 family serine peptidase [Oligoflexia bacterium]
MKKHLLLLIFTSLISITGRADSIQALPEQDYFVRFQAESNDADRAAFLKTSGLKVEWQSSLVEGLVRVSPLQAGRTFKMMPKSAAVVYMEPNYRIHRTLDPIKTPVDFKGPTDEFVSRQWALSSPNGINPKGAWAITEGSRGVKVAILDTGIEATHPDLADRVVTGYDFINHTDKVKDTHGHGTHVSGIIGAAWNNGGVAGINSLVTLIPVKVVPDNGDETDANLVEAFEFAVEKGARIANCSFGKDKSAKAVAEVIEAAGKKGLLVIVAAGNDSDNNDQDFHYPASFRTSNMIVVASSTSAGTMSGFSNYGVKTVDVGAPGSNIYSSVKGGRWQTMDGTSMATPQVVGVAALVLAANPSLTVAQMKDVLLSTVSKRKEWDKKVSTGGIIDATAAVKAAKAL